MFVNKFLQSCTILNTLKPFSIKSVNLKHTLRRLKMLFLEKSNVKDSDTSIYKQNALNSYMLYCQKTKKNMPAPISPGKGSTQNYN